MEGQVTAVLQVGQGSLKALPALPLSTHEQQSQGSGTLLGTLRPRNLSIAVRLNTSKGE